MIIERKKALMMTLGVHTRVGRVMILMALLICLALGHEICLSGRLEQC